MTRWCVTLLILLTAGTILAQGPELEVLQTVEGGGDDLLHGPDALCFGPDSSRYVLNTGDCRVLQFDAQWELVRAFGRQGEGPGEFTNPTGMILRQGKLWVFEMMRATLFSLEGEYLETRSSRLEMHEPISTERGILIRLGSNERMLALFNDQLELVTKMGPECPGSEDFMAQYKACGFVRALPHPDHLALLLNPLDGHLWVLGNDGEVERELALMESEGASSIQEEDGGESVTMSFSLIMGAGGVDRHGRYWSLPFPPDADEDAPQVLVVLGREDLKPVIEVSLPDEVLAFRVFHAPDGTLVLLDGMSSLVHVCAYPPELATD